jgi:hypothetical protein
MPSNETADPIRAKFLMERVDPKCKKSSKATADPKRTKFLIAIAAPK